MGHLNFAHCPESSLLRQLQIFERLDLASQEKAQLERLKKLLLHAQRFNPFWRNFLGTLDYLSCQRLPNLLERLPILTRIQAQEQFEAMASLEPGMSPTDLRVVSSSGSTGVPVRILKSKIHQGPLDSAYALLQTQWHHLDPNSSIAFLGFGIKNARYPSWGQSFEGLHYQGAYLARNISQSSLQSHLDWLIKERPAYLKASPFLVAQLAHLALEQGVNLPLKAVLSQSEKVSSMHRSLCREAFGAPIIDRYSSEETGLIALQCPIHEHFHVLNASVIVEIVDEAGRPCESGVVGRALITSLASYAMPIIRYDLGDFVSWGKSCDCGITLPVISKLWGRVRNAVIHADNTTHPMGFLGDELSRILNIVEFRILQYPGKELDLELVCKEPLSAVEISKIKDIFTHNGLAGLVLFIEQVPALRCDLKRKREEFERVDKNWSAQGRNLIKVHL